MKVIDVTKDNQPMVLSLKIAIGADDVQMFEYGNTEFILSLRGSSKHLSIFNPHREVKKSEIEFATKKFFKKSISTLKKNIGSNGIVHLRYGEEGPL